MYWADKIAKEIIDSGKYRPYWVDDMFTPSGYAHIGSLRGPLIHDLIYRALLDNGAKATFTYIFNDFDPIDGLPPDLQGKFDKYLGFPLSSAPSPEPGFSSFAHYFSEDFKKVLNNLGVEAKYLSSWDMYHEGRFNEVIRIALDNAEKIQDIYQRVSGSRKKEKGWLPLQVICEKCGKLGTTRVHNWDGKTIEYICEPELVTWASGCGYSGKISPFDGNGKLPWKVDWPAHWKVLGVTIEGAGKDHASRGGSYDIAFELCKEVFHIQKPYYLPYEHFLLGGKKMSSSKGIGLKARNLTELLPESIARFLFSRTDYRQTIEFDLIETMVIPDLFDEYDRSWQAYNSGSNEDLFRIFELSQIDGLPSNPKLFLPRFRDIANFAQLPNVKLWEKFKQIKGSELTELENDIIGERLTYAFIWLSKYAPDEYRYQISLKSLEEINLTDKQWEFLNDLSDVWVKVKDPEELQSKIFRLIKAKTINFKEAFKALYTVLLDKTYGPRAGWLLKKFPSEVVVERLTLNKQQKIRKQVITVKTISRPDIFSIDKRVKDKYPSVSVGVAIIRDVKIQKTNPALEKEKEEFLKLQKGLTTERLGQYPEIQSYRKLYKEMGIDWHSRRPSPEALLRRIALNKGLYTINTCVDAYNLVVMKNRVSVGAFDLGKFKLPTVLRFPKIGEEILLLGDKTPTKYTEKELAYFDQIGGYNIDFNYRDAQRTAVTDTTKNLIINVDGVYDISPQMVQKSLRQSVEIIVKYCGGEVEFEGMIV